MTDAVALGIDLSLLRSALVALRCSSFDFSIGRGPEVVAETLIVPPKKLRGMARLEYIELGVAHSLDRLVYVIGARPRAVIFEGPGFGSQVAHALGNVHGIVKLRLWQVRDVCGFELVADLPPANLKQFVTDKGNSEKSVVMKSLLRRYGYDNDDDNLNDAYACALVGLCRLLGGGTAMQRRVANEKLEVDLYEGESEAAKRRRALEPGAASGALAGRVRRRRLP